MYDAQDIVKGIRNPSLAWKEVRRLADEYSSKIIYPSINTYKHVEQYNETSEYGLVINWGHYVRDQWVVAMYPFLAEAIVERFDPLIIPTQRAYDRHKEHLDYVISFESGSKKAPVIDYDTGENHTTAIFASDPHNKTDWFDTYVHENEIDYVLSPYYQPFLYWFPDFDTSRLIHFPWAVPREFTAEPRDLEFRDQEAIYLFGATGGDIYEVRDWCREFPFVSDFYHSGHQNRVMSHEEYYQWCQHFDSAIAAGGHREGLRYLFAKYIEIPAAGSLLFAQDSPDLGRAGFTSENSVIFRKDDFEEKAKRYLREPETFLNVRKRGVNLVRDRHTISDRVATIDELLS